jgi:ABC-type nitrate/sulfonate/bicarbonate transport system substrate-binding protein
MPMGVNAMSKSLERVAWRMSPGMTRRQFGTRAAGAAAAFGLAGLLDACGGSSTSTTKAGLTAVKFQQSWLIDVEFAGVYTAMKRGIFAKYGLEVTPLPAGPSLDPRTTVSAGTALLGTVSEATDEVLGIASGAPYKAIGAVYQKNPGCLMVRPDVTSVQQLKGKSIGLQNDARQQVEAILKHNGMSPSEVNLVTVGSDPQVFADNKVQAYTAFAFNEPVALGLQGIKTNCLSFSDIGLPGYGDSIIADQKTIDTNPDLLARFIKALRLGWQYTIDHTSQVAAMCISDFKLDEGKAQQDAQIKVEVPMLQSAATRADGLLTMQASVWQGTINFMSGAKMLNKPVTVDDVMTMDILNRAKSVT